MKVKLGAADETFLKQPKPCCKAGLFFHGVSLQEEGYLMAMTNEIIFKRKRFFQVLRSSSQRRPRLICRQKNPPRGPQKQSEALTSSSWKEFPSALSLELVQRQDPQRGHGKIAGSCRAEPKPKTSCCPSDATAVPPLPGMRGEKTQRCSSQGQWPLLSKTKEQQE